MQFHPCGNPVGSLPRFQLCELFLIRTVATFLVGFVMSACIIRADYPVAKMSDLLSVAILAPIGGLLRHFAVVGLLVIAGWMALLHLERARPMQNRYFPLLILESVQGWWLASTCCASLHVSEWF